MSSMSTTAHYTHRMPTHSAKQERHHIGRTISDGRRGSKVTRRQAGATPMCVAPCFSAALAPVAPCILMNVMQHVYQH